MILIPILSCAATRDNPNDPLSSKYSIGASVSPTSSATITFNLVASDDLAVAAWMITESSAQPSATDSGWLTALPTSYVLSNTIGAKEVFAWVKDSAGNVSTVTASSHFYGHL